MLINKTEVLKGEFNSPLADDHSATIHVDFLIREGKPVDSTYTPMQIENYEKIYAFLNSIPGIYLNNADSKDNLNKYLLHNPGQSFVCKRDGKIIGTIMCGNDGRRSFIYHLAVAPKQRRCGIGAELVRLAIQEQKALGIDKCALFILNNNTSGKEFWMRMGFSDVQEAGTMAMNI